MASSSVSSSHLYDFSSFSESVAQQSLAVKLHSSYRRSLEECAELSAPAAEEESFQGSRLETSQVEEEVAEEVALTCWIDKA